MVEFTVSKGVPLPPPKIKWQASFDRFEEGYSVDIDLRQDRGDGQRLTEEQVRRAVFHFNKRHKGQRRLSAMIVERERPSPANPRSRPVVKMRVWRVA